MKGLASGIAQHCHRLQGLSWSNLGHHLGHPEGVWWLKNVEYGWWVFIILHHMSSYFIIFLARFCLGHPMFWRKVVPVSSPFAGDRRDSHTFPEENVDGEWWWLPVSDCFFFCVFFGTGEHYWADFTPMVLPGQTSPIGVQGGARRLKAFLAWAPEAVPPEMMRM